MRTAGTWIPISLSSNRWFCPLHYPQCSTRNLAMAAHRVLSRSILTLTSRPSTPRLLLRTARIPISSTPSLMACSNLHASAQHLKPAAAATALGSATEYPTTHEQISSPADTQNFLDNQFLPSKTSQWIDLHDPATNNLVTRVPQSTDEELQAAVESAKKAFPAWKATSVLHRQQIMFKFVALIREHWDRLAANITLEQGKTFADAKGDVLRGLQVAETACGITTQITGEVLEVAKDMETRSYRLPLGVVAAICPFSEFTIEILDLCLIVIHRLSRYDSIMVYSNCYNHWKHPHPETIRTRSRRCNDTR